MFMGKDPILPIDEPSLDKYCTEIRPLPKEVKDYRKCVDAFSKQVISIILPNLAKALKRVCTSHKEVTKTNMRCATKSLQIRFQSCFDEFSIRTKYIAYKLAKSTDLLSQMCCNFHGLRKCLDDRVDSSTCKQPKANLAKYLSDYASALGQEVVSFSCSKYQEYEICEKLGVIKQIGKYKEADVQQHRDEFILIPLIKGTQNVVRT